MTMWNRQLALLLSCFFFTECHGLEVTFTIVDGKLSQKWSTHTQESTTQEPEGSQRGKRDVSHSHCVHSEDTHVALLASLEDTVTLPCYACNVQPEDRKYGKVWYKFHRVKNSETNMLLWQTREVDLDMFSDPNLNRVHVTMDHTLIIKDMQPSDMGTYFCVDSEAADESALSFFSPDMQTTSAATMATAWDFMQGNKHLIQTLYHLDVEMAFSRITVSETGIGYPKPSLPEENVQNNWMLYTAWSEWSPCNVCGTAGERRRTGICMIKRSSDLDPTYPYYLHQVLNLYPAGAPCHSTLFTEHAFIIGRQDEMEIGECQTPCTEHEGPEDEVQDSGFLDHIVIDVAKPLKKPPKANKETVIKHKGDKVELNCPNQSLSDVIHWQNGTRLLLADEVYLMSSGRVEIYHNFSLAIHYLIPSDAGKYSCWINNTKTAIYTLKVEGSQKDEDISWYIQVLFASYIVDFAIFILILCGQIIHRACQTKMRKKRNSQRCSRKSNIGKETDTKKDMKNSSVELLEDTSNDSDFENFIGKDTVSETKKLLE